MGVQQRGEGTAERQHAAAVLGGVKSTRLLAPHHGELVTTGSDK
jgi:hypothetical protein